MSSGHNHQNHDHSHDHEGHDHHHDHDKETPYKGVDQEDEIKVEDLKKKIQEKQDNHIPTVINLANRLEAEVERKQVEAENRKKESADSHKHDHSHGSEEDLEAQNEGDGKDFTEGVVKKLVRVSCITLIFMLCQFVGGLMANSIAIMLDTAHMLTDLTAFLIALFSIWLARKQSTNTMSYGWVRSEVIGNLLSIMMLWGITLALVVSAVGRVIHQEEIDRLVMLITAVVGLIFNVIMGCVLHSHDHGHAGHSHGHDHGHAGHSHGHDHGHSHGHSEHSHKHNELHSHPHDEHSHDHGDGKKCSHGHGKKKDKADPTGQAQTVALAELHVEMPGDSSPETNDLKSEKSKKKDKKKHDHKHDHKDEHKDCHKEEERTLAATSEKDNLNLRAAMVHVIGDLLNSVGVVIASVIIYIFPNATIADPICTFIFSVFVIVTTIPNLKDSLRVLMEGAPPGFDTEFFDKFKERLAGIANVVEIHDLHIWALSIGKPVLSAHILSTDPVKTLHEATKMARKLGIFHSTIQVEGVNASEEGKALISCKHNIHN